MSRSYKKEPVVKDYNRNSKKYANRKVRRIFKNCDYPNGSAYKKLYCSWDICDWRFRETYREYEKRAKQYKFEYIHGITKYDLSTDMNHWEWYKMHKRK